MTDRLQRQIYDPTPRHVKIGDAFSQLICVANPFWDHTQTTANESVSGRAHRMGWHRLERWIDWVFLKLGYGPDHCKRALEADIDRARMTVEWADGR